MLLQRNQVLRQVRERRQPPSALDPWTEQLVELGTVILHQRLGMLAAVDARARGIFRDLSGLEPDLRLVYRSTVLEGERAEGVPALVGIRECFAQRQQQLAGREVEQAASLVGPHRDDVVFMLGGVDLNTYGSRGQQRLAVLALKLAEVGWMEDTLADLPVLLLDDVLSELDPEKRQYVLDRLSRLLAPDAPRGQVWITTTDTGPFSDEQLASAQHFQIDAGRVRRA